MLKILLLFSFLGCAKFVEQIDPSYHDQVVSETGAPEAFLFFSHNVHGETHPCGCKHFPRGGLAQLNALLETFKAKGPTFYVDTGDSLFPSIKIPDSVKDSITFTAQTLAESWDKLNMKIFVPGEKDFAMGEAFLVKMSQQYNYRFVVANFSKRTKIKHQKFLRWRMGNRILYMVGIVEPSLYPRRIQTLFTDPKVALENVFKEIKSREGALDHKMLNIILLSHSGYQQDEKWAKQFPFISWIIGAHSQKFTTSPLYEGKTGIVQVLSRNHYVGQLTFPLNKNKSEIKFDLVDLQSEWQDRIKDNPFIPYLDKYKSQLGRIQIEEQERLTVKADIRLKTYHQCMECHQAQYEFWSKTSHALAYPTLVRAKQPFDLNCIECHSVGKDQNGGFVKAKGMAEFQNPKTTHEKYFAELDKAFKDTTSFRKMSNTQRKKHHNQYMAIEKKYGVERNFANVQCLNCHDKDPEHPFSVSEPLTSQQRFDSMKSRCIKCHTLGQTPRWYTKRKNEYKWDFDESKMAADFKKMACPKDN